MFICQIVKSFSLEVPELSVSESLSVCHCVSNGVLPEGGGIGFGFGARVAVLDNWYIVLVRGSV